MSANVERNKPLIHLYERSQFAGKFRLSCFIRLEGFKLHNNTLPTTVTNPTKTFVDNNGDSYPGEAYHYIEFLVDPDGTATGNSEQSTFIAIDSTNNKKGIVVTLIDPAGMANSKIKGGAVIRYDDADQEGDQGG